MKKKSTVKLMLIVFVLMTSYAANATNLIFSLGFSNQNACIPGTLTMTATAYSNAGGCITAYALNLQYSTSPTGPWTVLKTYPSTQFTYVSNIQRTFTDDLSNSNYSTGYFRMKLWYEYYYNCIHCWGNDCGDSVYTWAVPCSIVYDNAGADKTYFTCTGTRVSLGLAPNIGSNNFCTPTYTWSPTGDLYYTSTGGTPCNPCTTATIYCTPSSSPKTYTRIQTCGTYACSDGVKVTTNYVGCRSMNSNGTDGDIKVYPNPNAGNFTVELREGIDIENIKVYNEVGQLQKISIDRTLENIVIVRDLSKGFYILKITDTKGSFIGRITVLE